MDMDGPSAWLMVIAHTSATQDPVIHPPYRAIPDMANQYPGDRKVIPIKYPGKRKTCMLDNVYPSVSRVAAENHRLPVHAGPLYIGLLQDLMRHVYQ